MASARRGDRAAYGTVVARHEDVIFAVLSRLLRPAGLGHEVEDLAQETFLRAYRSLARFDPQGPASFRTWLLKIATNLALDRLKAWRRRAPTEPVLHLLGDERFGADADRRRGELGASIERAVAGLTDVQRVTFVLREIHELGYEEIADILGITAGGARANMFRAREVLCAALAQLREDIHES